MSGDFGPERIAELIAGEELIAAALTDVYQQGKIHYAHYSPAHDVTACRLVALMHVADALAAATGTAKTAEQAECEASQSGGEAATPSHQVAQNTSGDSSHD